MDAVLDAPSQDLKLAAGDRQQWHDVNRAPFVFEHRLANHPLFEVPRLTRLAQTAIENGRGDPYASADDRQLDLSERTRRMRNNMAQLDTGNCWLKVSAVHELDPEYDALLQSLLVEMERLTDLPIRDTMTWSGLDVFMNSPHLQVPYHFDHDTNFLMQIRGEKDVRLFDPTDRSVLTEAEIEDFYRGNKLAGRFHDAIKDAGTLYHLSPGLGVHHPPLAPHLIRNGDQVSISVAFYFVLPPQERVAHIYQANHFMRKLGLHPRPPGESGFSDWAKDSLMTAISKSHPTSYDERLYSGVQRLGSPTRLAKRVAGALRSHH